jgi:phosphoglycolate phosphatase
MLPPKAVVFDLDGTLIDSRGDIVAAVNHALAQVGRTPLPAQVIVRNVGDGARTLLARCTRLGEQTEEVDRLLQHFIEHYSEHPVDFTRWMPGAVEALDTLGEWTDLVLGICTNKPRQTTEAVLAALGVRTRFRAIVAGGDLSEKKPAPGPLLHIGKLLHVSSDTMVMVGDSAQDVDCAKNAGCRSIGVDGGFGARDRLLDARPDVLLASLLELPDVLNRWREATARVSILRRP